MSIAQEKFSRREFGSAFRQIMPLNQSLFSIQKTTGQWRFQLHQRYVNYASNMLFVFLLGPTRKALSTSRVVKLAKKNDLEFVIILRNT